MKAIDELKGKPKANDNEKEREVWIHVRLGSSLLLRLHE
jgi:hypothetical protein